VGGDYRSADARTTALILRHSVGFAAAANKNMHHEVTKDTKVWRVNAPHDSDSADHFHHLRVLCGFVVNLGKGDRPVAPTHAAGSERRKWGRRLPFRRKTCEPEKKVVEIL
jgi:hypothetical protein